MTADLFGAKEAFKHDDAKVLAEAEGFEWDYDKHPDDCGCWYCQVQYTLENHPDVTYEDILAWEDKQHEGVEPY